MELMCASDNALTNAEIDLFAAGRSAVFGECNRGGPTPLIDGNIGSRMSRENAGAVAKEIVTYLRTNGPTFRMRVAFLRTLNYGTIRAVLFAINHPDDELFNLMAHKITNISRKLV
ncbi:MAG: hypothetical protein LBB38_04620 [Puniceicoccales bacterium]|jgi:hypothetical protein|nr:hypothetical protein [Puniceicoccales bacterium]